MRRPLSGRRGAPSNTHSDRRWRPPTPSAGLLVAIVALVVALSGTAYAGMTLGKNSVGTKQLKNKAVTNDKLAKAAVGNGKIAKGAITSGKLSTKLVAPSATALAKVTYVQSADITSPKAPTAGTPSDTKGSIDCPTGTSAISGGFTTSAAALEINESQPTFTTPGQAATGWDGFIDNFDINNDHTFSVWAICAPVTTGVSPSGPGPGPVR
jgi:hypothetical protein